MNTEHVNDRQVGGSHYVSSYQHWDWVVDHDIPYLLGCATKYLIRWKKKNGIEDLEKSYHYVEKYIQGKPHNNFNRSLFSERANRSTERFLSTNDVDTMEIEIIWQILYMLERGRPDFRDSNILTAIRKLIEKNRSAATGGGS